MLFILANAYNIFLHFFIKNLDIKKNDFYFE
jgi:hypothetical protein